MDVLERQDVDGQKCALFSAGIHAVWHRQAGLPKLEQANVMLMLAIMARLSDLGGRTLVCSSGVRLMISQYLLAVDS